MKKTIFILTAIGFLSTVSAEIIFNAKDARITTNQSTKKLTAEVLSSENGKKAYLGLTKIFNDNIARIASEGFYDTFSIKFMNEELGDQISPLLKPLTRKEQDVIRTVIINELVAKGFKITKNQFWDNPDDFNIAVSW